MAKLGHYNQLRILRRSDYGLFLDGENYGDILLPRRFVTAEMQIGESVEVFLCNDSEDRIVATTETPKAVVGECAYLKVVSNNRFGAFLDWGLPKDLLVPRNEQQKPMQKGYSYTVYLYVDENSERIAASNRLENWLSLEASHFKPRQAVDLLIYAKSDLGFKAVINNSHLGQLYNNEVFKPLHYGERMTGYIKRLRPDGRIDLSLQPPTDQQQDLLGDAILAHLQQNDGVSPLTDSSTPDDIYRQFGVSKASYKRALGRLYRQRRIVIEKQQITLV